MQLMERIRSCYVLLDP